MPNVRVDLNTKSFPYNFRELGNTVVIPTALDAANPPTCGAYYLDNVLPITNGYASAAFTAHIPAISAIVGTVQYCKRITAADGSLAYLAFTSDKIYVYDALSPDWRFLRNMVAGTAPKFASVKGEYFIFLRENYEIVKFNFQLGSLEAVTTLGLDLTEIYGITGNGDRMVLWTTDRVFWSSYFNPLDFVPSIATGAGSTNILAVNSAITQCVPLGADFIIYTTSNAVSARKTNDFASPYIFAEIPSSAGVVYDRHIANNSNNGVHIVWTASGFQQVTAQAAEYIFPELSEGISRGLRSTINPVYQQPELIREAALDVSLSFASNRMLCVSVAKQGIGYYTDCYMLDTSLGRWGKLTCNHSTMLEYWPVALADVFSYDDLATDIPTYNDFTLPYYAYGVDEAIIPPVAGDNLGVVTPEGAILTVAPHDTAVYRGSNVGLVAAPPRAFFGKFRLQSSTGCQVHGVRLTNIHSGQVVLHGHLQAGEYVRRFAGLVSNPYAPGHWTGGMKANTISVEINGAFTLSDLSVTIDPCGSGNYFNPDDKTQTWVLVDTLDTLVGQRVVKHVPILTPSALVPQSGG